MSFLSTLAQHIKDRYDLRNESLTVVFPNKRAAFYLRSRFKTMIKEDIWMPQMLSIEEAMSQWSGIQIADTVDLLFELIAIEAEMGGTGNLSVFGSMANQMAKDFDEVDQYAVDADHLFSYIYEQQKIGVWNLDGGITPKEQAYLNFFQRLKIYYDRLRQRLSEQGKGYYGQITRTLSEMDGTVLQEKTNGKRILFAGFNALTPTEQKIIDTLYKNGQAEVIWDFDRYYVEDPLNEAGLFARRYLDRNVPWKPSDLSNQLENEEKEIHLVSVTGNTIQAKALQSLLATDPDTDHMAVILADENLLIPVLNSIPDQERYASIKVSMGYPLRQTALNALVTEFFTLHRKGRKVGDRGWYLWPILRIFNLEMTRVLFNQEELRAIEKYQTQVKEQSLFIYQEELLIRCQPSQEVLRFMRLLLGDSTEPYSPSSLLDTLVTLLQFIGEKLQKDGSSHTFLLNQVSEMGKAINRLKSILKRHQQAIHNLDELEVLYRLIHNNAAIKLNSSSTDGLQLMGILEARNLDFERFYMVGVNEGILPTEKSQGSFIPYNIRKECGLPDFQEKQAVFAYHFYRQLQGARKAYYLYNSSSENNRGEPSRFLMQLKYELARRNPKVKIIEEAFMNKTETARTPTPLYAKKSEEVMKKLMDKVQTTRMNEALAPTSLSTYITCPLKFFLKYLMKIKDNSVDEETQDNDIGTVVHDTLELLYRDHLGALVSPEFFTSQILPSWSGKLEEAIGKHFGQGLPDVGFNFLNKLIIEKQMKHYLEFEKEAIQHEDLYILNVEHTLHAQLKVNGIPCVIAGKADRIERRGGLIRIVDYKTGSVFDRDVKVPKTVEDIAEIPEKALQLLIYKFLYLKEHPEVAPEQVTASIYALRMPHIVFDLQVEDTEWNEHFMETMEYYLTDLLSRMLDPETPFEQSMEGKNSPCEYCDYRDLCVNTARGASQEDDH